jgi:hypothetical protein
MKKYTIGRNPEADIILATNLCSRDHAQLTVSANGSIYLQDHSTNGTTVKGKKINQQTVEIKEGDDILFGGVERLDWSKVTVEKPIDLPIEPKPTSEFILFAKKHSTKLIGVAILIGVIAIATNLNNSPSKQKTLTMSATEVYETYKNSVALVEVQYYVRINTKANDVYFGLKADGEIGFSKSKTELKPLSSEGTAFFIDSNGMLVTNHHVIEPWSYDKDLKNYFFKKVKPAIQRALRENGWGNDVPTFHGELEAVYIYPNGEKFSPENGLPCSIHQIADREEIDLATISLNMARLPEGATIVSLSQLQADEKTIRVGSPAYVLGFPYGDELATNEENVLNCTSTQGNFTQAPSKFYIQYSAQTASGGSGSPVFNEYGQLVAVTYLGTTSGQSFNRGILAKHLQEVR